MHLKGRWPGGPKNHGGCGFFCAFFRWFLLKIGLFHHENWPVDGWIWQAWDTRFFFGPLFFFGEKAGSRRGDLMVIRFRGYRSFQKCHSLTRWRQLRCFKFSPPKIRGKDEAILTTSIFLKGVGLVQPPTCLGSREEMFTFYFLERGFQKRGSCFVGQWTEEVFFWKRPSLSLRVCFFLGGCQFPSK